MMNFIIDLTEVIKTVLQALLLLMAYSLGRLHEVKAIKKKNELEGDE